VRGGGISISISIGISISISISIGIGISICFASGRRAAVRREGACMRERRTSRADDRALA